MSIEIAVPTTVCSVTSNTVSIIDICNPAAPIAITANETNVFIPLPPGVALNDLPLLQIIDTSPNEIIGCVLSLSTGQEENQLNQSFPSAISGDGVINKDNNDIWIYDGTNWENAGQTPGLRISTQTSIPPWNEKIKLAGTTKTLLSIKTLPYALGLSTSFTVTTRTKLNVGRRGPIEVSSTGNIEISVLTPTVAT